MASLSLSTTNIFPFVLFSGTTILPVISKAKSPPLVSLSVPMMMLLEASVGWIQMAGSSVSKFTFSVIYIGFNLSLFNPEPTDEQLAKMITNDKYAIFFKILINQ